MRLDNPENGKWALVWVDGDLVMWRNSDEEEGIGSSYIMTADDARESIGLARRNEITIC